jgi:hypothetical protein
MKTLFFGIVLIIVLGLGGFFYKSVADRTVPGGATACTLEAKICPNGASVGRTGPSCAFAACPFPNVEFTDKNFAFALPVGYTSILQNLGVDGKAPGLLDTYGNRIASTTLDTVNSISVYSFPIPEGKTADEVMLQNTIFYPSGNTADSLDKFTPVLVNGTKFEEITLERFEGVVASAYYLQRTNDVLRFEIVERDVANWTDPKLVIDQLPEHKKLLDMLGTLQSN